LRVQSEANIIEITETPKEKFERIQREFQELQQELSSGSEHKQDSQLCLLLQEIDNLQSELSNIIISSGKNFTFLF